MKEQIQETMKGRVKERKVDERREEGGKQRRVGRRCSGYGEKEDMEWG